jgi:hypothetical protein
MPPILIVDHPLSSPFNHGPSSQGFDLPGPPPGWSFTRQGNEHGRRRRIQIVARALKGLPSHTPTVSHHAIRVEVRKAYRIVTVLLA